MEIFKKWVSILHGFETENKVTKYQGDLASAGKLLIQSYKDYKSPISSFGRSKYLQHCSRICWAYLCLNTEGTISKLSLTSPRLETCPVL